MKNSSQINFIYLIFLVEFNFILLQYLRNVGWKNAQALQARNKIKMVTNDSTLLTPNTKMIQSLPIPMTVNQFLDWYPTDWTQFRYELHNGFIKQMPPPTGDHELVIAFLIKQILLECVRLVLPYDIPKMGFVQSFEDESAFLPDVLLLNRPNLVNEPLWRNKSTLTQAASIPLAIEVVSTNWRDDYFTKLGQYEAIGIREYWIVDYAALGGRKFIGNPKQPTISIYSLVEGEYQIKQFQNGESIKSQTFPDLNLTAEQIFQSAYLG